MTATEFSWTTRDGLKIYAKDWSITQPKGVICLVHGMGEHINRYNHFAAFFNKNGYAVIGYDRRGHGKSEGKRGHTPGYVRYMNEIAQLMVEAEERYPNVPTFLYGHSMGGNLSLKYTLERHPTLNGLIVTGPWIKLAFQPPSIMVGIAKIAKRVMPGFTQNNDLEADHLTRDPLVNQAYLDDPLVHNKITAMTAASMLEAAAELNNFNGEIKVPTLIMHGSQDKIIDYGAAEHFAKRVKGTDVTFKGWDGFYHEIHNEKEQLEVFAYTLRWLNGHL